MDVVKPKVEVDNRRRSFRTESRITVEAMAETQPVEGALLKDVSREGIGLLSWEPIRPGQKMQLRFPELKDDLKVEAEVTRCHCSTTGRFEIGLKIFLNHSHLYKLLYDDIWEIECYRQIVESSRGEKISSREAMKEWKERFSGYRASRYKNN